MRGGVPNQNFCIAQGLRPLLTSSAPSATDDLQPKKLLTLVSSTDLGKEEVNSEHGPELPGGYFKNRADTIQTWTITIFPTLCSA